MDGRDLPLGPRALGRSLSDSIAMGEQAGKHRADQRGMDQGPGRRRRLGSDLVEVMTGLVELVIGFDFPADAVDVSDLARAHLGRQVRQIEAIAAVWSRNADQATADLACTAAYCHLGIDEAPAQDKHVIFEQCVQIGPGEEGAGDLAARDPIHLGLPAVLEAKHEAHVVLGTVGEELKAGIAQVDQEAEVSPGLVQDKVRAVVLSRRAEMVVGDGAGPDREALVDLEGGILAGAGIFVFERGRQLDGFRVDDVPVARMLCKQRRKIERLLTGEVQGALRHLHHRALQGRPEPGVEAASHDRGPAGLEIEPHHVRLPSAVARRRRDHHGADQAHGIALAGPLLEARGANDGPKGFVRKNGLEDLADIASSQNGRFTHAPDKITVGPPSQPWTPGHAQGIEITRSFQLIGHTWSSTIGSASSSSGLLSCSPIPRDPPVESKSWSRRSPCWRPSWPRKTLSSPRSPRSTFSSSSSLGMHDAIRGWRRAGTRCPYPLEGG